MKRRPDKRNPGRTQAQITAPTAPISALALSRTRQWLFRLIAAVLLPLLLVLLLECVLRLAGYGHPTGFFQKVRIGNRERLVNNEAFSLRFFPPQLARWPGSIMMEAAKPADTYRIFILGESAARGEPEPPYSAARYLEILLRERFPGQKFEVVNVAITAINSHVILPIARDLARQHGDLWIIYMGNNEMVGPFGAATIFGAQAPPLPLVRMTLAIQQTRVGQLLMALARKARGKAATASSWGGMKMFLGNQVRPGSPRKETVYRSFEKNLHDILRAGLDSGAKVILNTVAVNLKDCPPFASLTNSSIAPTDRAAWNKAYADGCRAQKQGDPAGACRDLEQAARLDPMMSEVQFRWGECLVATTNFTAARDHLQLACDYDALPFRADSRINAIIRVAGQRWAGPNLDLVDAAAVLATNNPAGITGHELFYEHVHFNFDGNYRLGLAWAEQAERLLPATIRSRTTGGWASQQVCEQRLGLTDWNRCSVVMSVIQRLHREPFTNQLDNDARLAALQAEATALRRRMTVATANQARAEFVAAIQRAPDDDWLHENYAEFLESIGHGQEATAEWQQVRALLPQDCVAAYQVGRLLAQHGATAEAEGALVQAVTLRPSLTQAWFELGNLYLDAGRFEAALSAYDRARQLEPHEGIYYARIGVTLAKLDRTAEAIEHYHRAIEFRPDLAEAHFALGQALAGNTQFAEAAKEYEQVVRLQPTGPPGPV
jgi:tetratricopeptide (TPR) repeat protein